MTIKYNNTTYDLPLDKNLIKAYADHFLISDRPDKIQKELGLIAEDAAVMLGYDIFSHPMEDHIKLAMDKDMQKLIDTIHFCMKRNMEIYQVEFIQ